MSVINLKKENFEKEVKNYKGIVFIDLFANWCGPCMMMSPVIDEIAESLGDKVKFCKVDVDEEGELAMSFKANSIPMFVLIKDGKILNATIGFQPKEKILKFIESALK